MQNTNTPSLIIFLVITYTLAAIRVPGSLSVPHTDRKAVCTRTILTHSCPSFSTVRFFCAFIDSLVIIKGPLNFKNEKKAHIVALVEVGFLAFLSIQAKACRLFLPFMCLKYSCKTSMQRGRWDLEGQGKLMRGQIPFLEEE